MMILFPLASHTLTIKGRSTVKSGEDQWLVASLNFIVDRVSRVTKGDAVVIPILAINRSKALWGDDAAEFR
jgi:hypothetical protein